VADVRQHGVAVAVFVSVLFVGSLAATGGVTAQTTAPDCSTVTYDTASESFESEYEVTNLSQLQCLGNESTGTTLQDGFVLVSDIDASGSAEWNGGEGFNPIGKQTSQPGDPHRGRFSGRFDGNNHTITGLSIDRPDENVGLFGASEGVIENVRLERVDIRNDGSRDAGGLVGFNFRRIESSSVTGRVSGGFPGGGLVGGNFGTINASHAAVRVTGTEDIGTGGLVGRNFGRINESYATGDVIGGSNVGGLVGTTVPAETPITASYATGDVTGERNVGGLLGKNGNENGPGVIKSSYATGRVNGSESVGGLVGYNRNGTVQSSYAAGTVAGGSDVGGLIGNVSPEWSAVTTSYWDRETTGQNDSAGSGVGLETDQMTGLSARDAMTLAFGTVWRAVPNRYPALRGVGTGAPPVNELPSDLFARDRPTFVSTPESPTTGTATTFRTTALDPGVVESFRWEFGDGTTATGMQVSHRYDTPGNYRVTHAVTTVDGTEFTRSRQITVEAADEFGIGTVTPHIDGVPQDDVAVLESVQFNLSYHVSVVGPGTTENVTFRVDGQSDNGTRNGRTWVFDVDPATLDPGAGFSVTVTNGTGATDTVARPIEVVDIPSWLEGFTGTVLAGQSTVQFEAAIGVPPSSFDLSLTIPDRFDFPVSIPLANQSQDPSAAATVTITVDRGTLSTEVTITGSTEYNLTRRLTARGSLGGTGYVDLQEGTLTRATARGTVGATIEYPPPPVGIPSPSIPPVPPGVVRLYPIFDLQLGTNANFEPGTSGALPLEFQRGSIEPQLTARQELGQKYEIFEIVFGLEERLAASIPVPGITPVNGSIGAQVYARASALGFQQRVAYPPGGDRLTYPFSLGNDSGTTSSRVAGWAATNDAGWRLKQSTGGTPPKPSALATDEAISTVDVTGSRFITNDSVGDANPSLTRLDDGHLVVWGRQDADASALNGRDIHLSRRTGGAFGGLEPVTNDSTRDFDPALAGPTRNQQVVVFSTLNRTVDPSTITGPGELFPNTEIALTTTTGDGNWTEPQFLTDETTDDRHSAPTIAYSNGTWLIAWQETVAETSDLASQQVNYLWYNDTTSETTSISGARNPVVAPTGDGDIQLAYLDMAGNRTTGNVTVNTFDPETRTRQTTHRYAVTRLTDIALGNGSLAWADEATTNPVEFVSAAGDTPAAVPVGLSSAPQSVELTTSNETTLLNVRAFAPNSSVAQVSYAARVDGKWLPAETYADGSAQNLTYWQGTSAPAREGFVSVFAGKELGTDQRYDLYSFDQEFSPDLSITATTPTDPANTTVGDSVALNYTVRNTGANATTTTPIGVQTNGTTSVVDTRGGLQPGDTLSGSIETTVDETGNVTVVADPQGETADKDRRNNSATLRLVAPTLTVSDVAVARDDGTKTFDVTVENPLDAQVPAFDYTVEAGPEIQAQGTRPSLAPGASTTLSLTAPVGDIDPQWALRVRASTSRPVTEDRSLVTFRTSLRPQLSLEPEQIGYYANDTGTVAVLSVGNTGLTTLEGVVNLTNESTGTIIGSEPIRINASDGLSDTTFARIVVPLGQVTEGQPVRVEISRLTSGKRIEAIAVDEVELGSALVPPDAEISVDRPVVAGRAVELTAVNVSSPVGEVTQFEWTTSDSQISANRRAVFTPQASGEKNVSLTVVNGQGIPQLTETSVSVMQPIDLNENGQAAYEAPNGPAAFDGMFDDVAGTGSFGIIDVVALFKHFGDAEVQNNAELFRFAAPDDPDPVRVGIADVVALFREI
jgi:hypothetical protein